MSRLQRLGTHRWTLPATGAMRAPVVVHADETLVREMDDKVLEQATNVASLPGIVDADEGGVISAGGVGFDIACGVRCLTTGLRTTDVARVRTLLASALFHRIPAPTTGAGCGGCAPTVPAARWPHPA